MLEIKTKVCHRCKEEKPVYDFSRNFRISGGINHQCKECKNEIRKKSTYNILRKCDLCNGDFKNPRF